MALWTGITRNAANTSFMDAASGTAKQTRIDALEHAIYDSASYGKTALDFAMDCDDTLIEAIGQSFKDRGFLVTVGVDLPILLTIDWS